MKRNALFSQNDVKFRQLIAIIFILLSMTKLSIEMKENFACNKFSCSKYQENLHMVIVRKKLQS